MAKPTMRLGAESFLAHFETLEDPRSEGMIDHLLVDIVVIALLAVICGAETWSPMETFGQQKYALLTTLLPLPSGIPSKHTFQRVFARLDPKAFEAAFRGWIGELATVMPGWQVALDGKTLRGSGKGLPRGKAMHLVHAWSVGNRVLLGQLATDLKSNEITAIPELVKLLDLRGAVVTIDAGGCHKAIAAGIVEAGADYVLAVKANPPTLLAAVVAALDTARSDARATTPHVETHNGGHGRQETRKVWATEARTLPMAAQWPGLRSCVQVESTCLRQGTLTHECRYFIASLPHTDVVPLAAVIRGHWAVENTLHWSLDVAFREDECLVAQGHGPENFSLLRKMAHTALTRDTRLKASIPERRKAAGWNDEYLLAVLRNGIIE